MLLSFLALVTEDLLCQYKLFGHHDTPTSEMEMSHCVYAHQANSTITPSLDLSNLVGLTVVGALATVSVLALAADLVFWVSARAPPSW